MNHLSFSPGSIEFSLEELDSAAATIGGLLDKHKLCYVGLKGELGAGKTTFVGALLRLWGLDPELPVPSPTFTCVQEYDLAIGAVAHCDFYRIDNPAQELAGLLDHREFARALIEWPKNLVESGELDILLRFEATGESSRKISWAACS